MVGGRSRNRGGQDSLPIGTEGKEWSRDLAADLCALEDLLSRKGPKYDIPACYTTFLEQYWRFGHHLAISKEHRSDVTT